MESAGQAGYMEDESLCVRCSRLEKTCCQRSEIYVTPGDVERIGEQLERFDFFEYRLPANADYADQDDDPAWQEYVFQADGTRRVLRRRPGGDCMMLGPHGCRLPWEVRPLVCRLYPYDYDERGIKPQLLHGCPVHLLKPGESLIAVLDMNIDAARRWHGQLYEEIRLETMANVDRLDLRPAC